MSDTKRYISLLEEGSSDDEDRAAIEAEYEVKVEVESEATESSLSSLSDSEPEEGPSQLGRRREGGSQRGRDSSTTRESNPDPLFVQAPLVFDWKRLPPLPNKRTLNLVDLSSSDSETARTTDSEADQSFKEAFDALPEDARMALIEHLQDPLHDDATMEDLENIDKRYQETEAYLADDSNYERKIEQPGGFLELIQAVAEKEGANSSESPGSLHSIFPPNSTRILTRQRHGTATCHLAALARIINAAAGGFFFLTSACGRKAFWTAFFPLVMPFFEAGGNGLIAIPAGELSVDALEEERSWQQVIEAETSGRLRFLFITDYDRFESWHIKEA